MFLLYFINISTKLHILMHNKDFIVIITTYIEKIL